MKSVTDELPNSGDVQTRKQNTVLSVIEANYVGNY